jgi:threonine/homoserine/homoserine lactone efflux protein
MSVMSLASLWIVLSFSFVVALSGAVMPGPLLTYTVAKTVASPRRGFLTGLWVTLGHAVLEAALILALLLGLSELLRLRAVLLVLGTVGCAVLLYMGAGLIRDALRRKTPDFDPESPGKASPLRRLPPVLGGALVSMSNPYWWIWWVTVGSAFMLRFDLSLARWPALTAFFVGHEAGDLAWYLTVSSLLYWGRRRLAGGAFRVLLLVCGVLIIAFGLYLGLSLYLRR